MQESSNLPISSSVQALFPGRPTEITKWSYGRCYLVLFSVI